MTSGSALRDRRSQSGAWLVKEMAQRLGAFRYLERECFRLLAGWMAVVPEWDVKLAFGKHVWEGAQHTERLGQRMVEHDVNTFTVFTVTAVPFVNSARLREIDNCIVFVAE